MFRVEGPWLIYMYWYIILFFELIYMYWYIYVLMRAGFRTLHFFSFYNSMSLGIPLWKFYIWKRKRRENTIGGVHVFSSQFPWFHDNYLLVCLISLSHDCEKLLISFSVSESALRERKRRKNKLKHGSSTQEASTPPGISP